MTADDLYAVCRTYVNEDQARVYQDAYGLLERLGSDDHALELANLLAQTEVTGEVMMGRIHALLTVALATQLTQYGITLIDDDVPLWVSTQLLEGLAEFEQAQLFEVTQWILSSDEYDNEERLAEILSMSTPLENVDVLHYVERVSPATIRRLREVVNETLSTHLRDEDTPSQPRIDDARRRVRLLHDIERCDPPGPLSVARHLAEKGFVLGHETDGTLDEAVNLLDEVSDEHQLAKELLGYLIYTGEDALSDIATFVDDYATTPAQGDRLLRRIDHLLTSKGYQRAEA